MSRVMFAIAFAGLIFAAASGTAHAVPILPLPAAATDGSDNMTDVQWGRRCWYDHWGRLRCRGGGWSRRCWQDSYGRRHCSWRW
jgi:hypothetical protein